MAEIGLAFYGVRYPRDWRWLWLKRREVRELQGLMHDIPEGQWVDLKFTIRAEDDAVIMDMFEATSVRPSVDTTESVLNSP